MPLQQPQDAVLRFLREYSTYYLFSHIEPDGDCLCSSAALGRYLDSQGKTVLHFNEGPFIRVEVQSYRESFLDSWPDSPVPDAAAVILDCSTPERIGRFAEAVQQMPSLVIDHHQNGEPFGDITYIETASPSTTLLIQYILEAVDHCITSEQAELLLFGLCTDTGFFRHLTDGQGEVLAAAGRLVDKGASPKSAYSRMFGGKSMASRKLLATLIDRGIELNDRRCVLTWEILDDVAAFGKDNRDSDLLYQLLLGTQRCSVVALARAETEGTTSISFRARDNTDVGSIARSLGGGGHRAAAGCTVSQPLDQAIEMITGILDELPIDTRS